MKNIAAVLLLICFSFSIFSKTIWRDSRSTSDVIKCYHSLSVLIEMQDYQGYELKLKECLRSSKGFENRPDLLSQSLFLNFNLRMSGTIDDQLVHRFYTEKYSNTLSSVDLDQITDETLVIAFETIITYNSIYYNTTPNLYSSFIFNEMNIRGIVKDSDVHDLFYISLLYRNFELARVIKSEYSLLKLGIVPSISVSPNYNPKKAGAYEFDNKQKLILKNSDFLQGKKIVAIVSPSCSPSNTSLNEIRNDSHLINVFKENGFFLVSQGYTEFKNVFEYNQHHPQTPFVISEKDSLWSPLEGISYGTPQYYFLNNGKIISHMIGWGTNSTEEMYQALQKIGL